MAGEASPGGSTPSLPPADVVDPYWIRYNNRTFLNKGQGPMSFMLQDMAKYVKVGDENWKRWFGTDKSKWIFNTKCCATQTYYRNAVCKASNAPPSPKPGPSPPGPKPSPSPGPGPSPPSDTCKAAIEKTCGHDKDQQCMECCFEHHDTLIKSCPGGREEMKTVCDS